jgi:lantibiotic modifying enzyme
VGLSRLDLFRRGEKDPIILEDIKRADRFVESIPAEQRNHLCCGSASRVDFLIEKSLVLGDSQALAMARKKVSELIRGKQVRGHYNFHVTGGAYYYNPTLFQGTTGVGYEILRVIAPETIETVLL